MQVAALPKRREKPSPTPPVKFKPKEKKDATLATAMPRRHVGWGGERLRQLDRFGLGQGGDRIPNLRAGASQLPQAADFPRGALVLSTDGTDRSNMRWSALMLGLILMAAGFGAGWIAKGRRG